MRARLLLLAASLAAFGGSLDGGFHLDDYATLAEAGRRAFGWPHPLTHGLDWLNFQLAGDAAVAWHGVNLLLHLSAVLLAWECLRRMLPPTAALVAAAIFAVHPLQAEAVDYVSGRVAMTVAILALAAMLAWRDRHRSLALALAAIALAEAVGQATPYGPLRLLRLFVLPWGFPIAPDLREPPWVYVAVFAFAAATGWLIARAGERCIRMTGGAVVAILIALSIGRTYVWNSDERLWREAVRHAPQLVEPKIELSKYLRAADALDLLTRARQQAPYNAAVPAQIGKVLLDEQQYQGAVDELSRAVAMDSGNALAFNNRGVALAALGQTAAAAADFERALALDPQLSEASENLKRLTGR